MGLIVSLAKGRLSVLHARGAPTAYTLKLPLSINLIILDFVETPPMFPVAKLPVKWQEYTEEERLDGFRLKVTHPKVRTGSSGST